MKISIVLRLCFGTKHAQITNINILNPALAQRAGPTTAGLRAPLAGGRACGKRAAPELAWLGGGFLDRGVPGFAATGFF